MTREQLIAEICKLIDDNMPLFPDAKSAMNWIEEFLQEIIGLYEDAMDAI